MKGALETFAVILSLTTGAYGQDIEVAQGAVGIRTGGSDWYSPDSGVALSLMPFGDEVTGIVSSFSDGQLGSVGAVTGVASPDGRISLGGEWVGGGVEEWRLAPDLSGQAILVPPAPGFPEFVNVAQSMSEVALGQFEKMRSGLVSTDSLDSIVRSFQASGDVSDGEVTLVSNARVAAAVAAYVSSIGQVPYIASYRDDIVSEAPSDDPAAETVITTVSASAFRSLASAPDLVNLLDKLAGDGGAASIRVSYSPDAHHLYVPKISVFHFLSADVFDTDKVNRLIDSRFSWFGTPGCDLVRESGEIPIVVHVECVFTLDQVGFPDDTWFWIALTMNVDFDNDDAAQVRYEVNGLKKYIGDSPPAVSRFIDFYGDEKDEIEALTLANFDRLAQQRIVP